MRPLHSINSSNEVNSNPDEDCNNINKQTIIQLFEAKSMLKEAHPSTTIVVPQEYKIVGGGGLANGQSSKGSLLTACFPQDTRTWFVKAKDHGVSDPSIVNAYALAICDPGDQYEVKIWSKTSEITNHPSASVSVGNEFTMTGGGAQVNWTGSGNLLTARFPSASTTWSAQSKDHKSPDPCSVTVFAIGIRRKDGCFTLKNDIVEATSSVQAHPSMTVSIESVVVSTEEEKYEGNTTIITKTTIKKKETIMTGGGARINWSGAGNLLTGTHPNNDSTKWIASSKDHQISSPASITVYAVSLHL